MVLCVGFRKQEEYDIRDVGSLILGSFLFAPCALDNLSMNEQSLNVEQLQQRFRHITVWRRGAERAPHKPLLLLYALGKCQRGEPRAIPYAEVDPALQRLLRTFGPPRQSYHSEFPFRRLQ